MDDSNNTQLESLTAESFALLAGLLRDCCDKLELVPPPTSQLGKFLSQCDFIADFNDVGLFDADGPAERDSKAVADAFINYRAFTLLGKALLFASDTQDIGQYRQFLRKNISETHGLDHQSLDRIFELVVAGSMAARGWSVSFSEPDVIAIPPEPLPSFGISCKRPRDIKSASRMVEDASKKLKKQKLYSCIVMSMDIVCANTGPGHRAAYYQCDSNAQLRQYLEKSIEGQLGSLESAIVRYANEYVIGIVLTASANGVSRKPSAVIWARGVRAVPILTIQGFGIVTNIVKETMNTI